MKRVLCTSLEGPSALKLVDVEARAVSPSQVRIRVFAAGVNFADTLIVRGKYQERPELPFTPGLEAAGEILEVGEHVANFKVGDRVLAIVDNGAYTQELVAEAARVVSIPDTVTFAQAAAIPVAYGTSHVALQHRAKLQPGETLLVHGASGGVGLTAVEIGKRMGATVIATGGSDVKLRTTSAYGADHVINYRTQDVKDAVRSVVGRRGVDVVYDPVGGDLFLTSLRCAAWEARLLIIGFAAGDIQQIPANLLLVKNCSAVGLYWGAYIKNAPHVLMDSLYQLLEWVGEGALKPHISHQVPLADVADALQLIIDRKAVGKVVLTG